MTGYAMATDGGVEFSHPQGQLEHALETGKPLCQYATGAATGVRNMHSSSFAVAEIVNPQTGKATLLNVILDTGANLSTFAKRAMQRIHAAGRKSHVCITGFGGGKVKQQAAITDIILKSRGGGLWKD
jgi:hypothetical protein